jgi:hypothetical protein
MNAGQIGVLFRGFAMRAVKVRNPHDAFGDSASDGGFDGAGHNAGPFGIF